MFKDARALDRQRTATSFEPLSPPTPRWPSPGSTAPCSRWTGSWPSATGCCTARATVARMTISDSNRYLAAAETE